MIHGMQPLRYALSLLLLVLAPVVVWAVPTVSDAWIPEAPPVSSVMAGFMTIHNPDATDVKIVGVQSEQFDAVQMHLSIEEKGVAKMLPQKILIVPAKGELQLKQGSYHLMLFSPVKPLQAGDKVTLTLLLADRSQLIVTADVKKMGSMKAQRENTKMKCGAGKCGR